MKKILLILLFSTSFFSFSFAQITAQVGGGISYNLPQGDAGGSTDEFYKGTKYGLSNGLSFFLKARAGILGTSFFAELDYTKLSGDGNADENRGTVEVKQNIFSIKLGPEILIDIPLSPVSPYIAPYISVNQFSGEVSFKGVSRVPSGTYDIKSTTRIGAGGAAGILFKLNPAMKIDLSIHYQLMNLFGKEFSAASTNPDRLDSYKSLNDDKDPLYQANDDTHIISDKRSINNLQFKVGLMIGL
uniref:Porin opacity type domain-containing protein n=1 Tax=Ignavibacterium album TaxID=591197 RepID=A0A832G1W5_9BACT